MTDYPPDVRQLCGEAAVLLDQERYDLAVPRLRRIVARVSDEPEPRQLLAAALRSSDQYAAAVGVARALVARFPTFAGGYYELSLATACLPPPLDEPTIDVAREAIRLEPGEPLYYFPIVAACGRRKAYADGVEWADRGLAVGPTNVPLRQQRAIALSALGRVDEAVAAATALLAEHPDEQTTQAAAGWVYLYAGRHAAAADHFRRSLAIRPGRQWAHEGLGLTLVELGAYAEAREHVVEALRLSPESPDAQEAMVKLDRLAGAAADSKG